MIQMEHKLKINSDLSNQRLDIFLSNRFSDHSRSYYQKLIKSGQILVNGEVVKPSHMLIENDKIYIVIPSPSPTSIQPENIPLNIVFEDEHLLVINKPAGLVVHPGAGVHSGTLVNALLYHCSDLSGVGGRQRPGIVHRLDKNTTGLLVVAKNDRAHIHLQKQFAEKTAQREYKALVWGHLPEMSGKIETLLNRSKSDRKKFVVAENGKSAITIFEVEEEHAFLSLVRVRLKTGRTHQIRTHFNHIHHPVFGDPEYAGRMKQINRVSTLSYKQKALYLLKLIDRQALHAFRLTFEHPISKEKISFTADLPEDFQNILDLSRNIERNSS